MMPYRALPDLYPDVERSALPTISPPSESVALDVPPRGVPADVLAPPMASATPSVAADAPTLAGVPTLRPPRNTCGTPVSPAPCSHPRCSMPAGRNVRGYCETHNDGYLTAAYELTQSIGRGELP